MCSTSQSRVGKLSVAQPLIGPQAMHITMPGLGRNKKPFLSWLYVLLSTCGISRAGNPGDSGESPRAICLRLLLGTVRFATSRTFQVNGRSKKPRIGRALLCSDHCSLYWQWGYRLHPRNSPEILGSRACRHTNKDRMPFAAQREHG